MLSTPLTSCSYRVEGPGLHRTKTVQFRDVGPNETVHFMEAFRAKRSGKKKIVATFSSNQIVGIEGSTRVDVRD